MSIRISSVNDPVNGGLAFTEKRLILVEGKDDQQFVVGMLENQSLDNFQVHSLGGKPSWRKKIGAIAKDPTFQDNVQDVGMFRDSDDNPDGAWRSCVDSLKAAGLPVPDTHSGLVGELGQLRVGVMLMPGREAVGALEELVIPALSPSRLDCVSKYQECLVGKGESCSASSKATLQVYLSGLPEPARDLHIAISQGHVDFSHPSLASVVDFLQALASSG